MMKNSMMDKIKVRAYDFVEDRMRYDVGAVEFKMHDGTISGVAFNFDFDKHFDDMKNNQFDQKLEFYDANCADIMFSTTQQDVEGNKIYEGDIVKKQDSINGSIKYFIVENDEYNTGFKPMTQHDVGYNSSLCWVMGNIYENKELLDKVTYL